MIQILQGTISYPEVKWGKPEDRKKNTPLIKFVDELVGVGADGIELWGRHLDGLKTADAKALAKKITDTGQKVLALAAYTDFSSSDDAVKASLEEAKRYLEFIDIFDCRKVRIFVGGPGSAEAKQEHWDRAVKGLKELVHMFHGTGAVFVCETHPDNLNDTVATSLKLMTVVNERAIRLNYQNMKGDPKGELNVLYRYVEHVHTSFVARMKSNDEEVMKELVRRGYDKTLTVEFCTDSLPAEGETFDRAKAIAGMKQDIALLKSLRK
jgi:sugar phosphate isomerase/epimerase